MIRQDPRLTSKLGKTHAEIGMRRAKTLHLADDRVAILVEFDSGRNRCSALRRSGNDPRPAPTDGRTMDLQGGVPPGKRHPEYHYPAMR